MKQYNLADRKHIWKNNSTEKKIVVKENTPSAQTVKTAFKNPSAQTQWKQLSIMKTTQFLKWARELNSRVSKEGTQWPISARKKMLNTKTDIGIDQIIMTSDAKTEC